MRYWAAAKEAAGTAEETVLAATLADALDAILASHPDTSLGAILARSSFLVDGRPAGLRAADLVPLPEGAVVEVLPAFAGG